MVLLKVVVSVEVVFGTCAMAKADPSALLSLDAVIFNYSIKTSIPGILDFQENEKIFC